MGDHRLVSQDARCQGPVPIDNVVGRAFMVVWPSSRWASLPVPATFDGWPTAARPPRPGPADPTGDVVLLLPVAALLAAVVRSGDGVAPRPRPARFGRPSHLRRERLRRSGWPGHLRRSGRPFGSGDVGSTRD